jgi:phosphatidylinositol alpha-1,6-mannosyltransferase
MNILLFTLEYPPFKGGVANYYYNVVKYWPSCSNASAGKPKPSNIFVLNNNKNQLIKTWFFPKWLLALYYLYKEIKTKKIDHILVGQILPLGTVAYLVTKLTKTPYSVFIHGMDFTFTQKSKRKAKISKKILYKAENIICSNNYVVELLNKNYFNEFKNKLHVVNPGINNELKITNYELRIKELKESYKLQNKIILFSVGRLVKRKGFDKVIEAMPEILTSIPDLVYVIAGTGPDEEYLKNKAKDLNNVIFLDSINDDKKWTWFNLCDIFITVSRCIDGDFEGFGIVYLEANLAGKPVIAGCSGGVCDAVQNNVNGIVVNPESPKEIAAAVICLAQDENLRKKLGGQGRERVFKDFRWEDKVNKIYKIIND